MKNNEYFKMIFLLMKKYKVHFLFVFSLIIALTITNAKIIANIINILLKIFFSFINYFPTFNTSSKSLSISLLLFICNAFLATLIDFPNR